MRRANGALLVMFLLGICGCAAGGRHDVAPPGSWTRTVERILDGGRGPLWEAAVQSLEEYRLERNDPAAGILVTGWNSTIEGRDTLADIRPVRIRERDSAPVQPPRIRLEFEVKHRLLVSLADEGDGKTRVTVTRHMTVDCLNAPSGAKNGDAFGPLVREEFDTDAELDALLDRMARAISK